jgi:hypothetical protein
MWTGSDVLFATRLVGGKNFPTKITKYPYFLGMTVFAKLADKFVEGHYVVSEHLKSELQPLKLCKPIKVLADPPKSLTGVVRKPHEGFNVLYYRPVGANQKFIDWVYGKDIVERLSYRLKTHVFTFHESLLAFDGIKIMEVTGQENMNDVYPYVDFVCRPNRHDGNPRMIMECEQLGIPYYWSKENPCVEDALMAIKVAMFNKTERSYSEQ